MISPADRLTPYIPEDPSGSLSELGVGVLQRAAALGGSLRPELRRPLAAALRQMNGYYSNLIEGHNTHPVDVERALRRDYAADPAKRALQLEALAHLEVQELIDGRLEAEPALDPTAPAFLEWIHGEFYHRMPAEFRGLAAPDGTRIEVEPGRLRDRQVAIQDHLPPEPQELRTFLERFRREYSPDRLGGAAQRVVAAAAAHHRLAWIHPFLDGNGRVCRLFTHAYLSRCGVDGHGLWTMSRGLGRNRSAYFAALNAADSPRQGDLDGRGNMSNARLVAFCRFFLETATDQIDFMASLLDLAGLEARLGGYVERLVSRRELRREAGRLLLDVLARGEVQRGEAARITGTGERVGRSIVSELVARGLLQSSTPKGPLCLGFPAEAVPYFFPNLYPAEVEMASEELARRHPAGPRRGPAR